MQWDSVAVHKKPEPETPFVDSEAKDVKNHDTEASQTLADQKQDEKLLKRSKTVEPNQMRNAEMDKSL